MPHIITTEETWVFFQPEMKEQSKEWKHLRLQLLTKPKSIRSAGEVMALVFRNTKGVLQVDYLVKGHTITGVRWSLQTAKRGNQEDSTWETEKRSALPQGQQSSPQVQSDDGCHPGMLIWTHPTPDLVPSDYYLLPRWRISSVAVWRFQCCGLPASSRCQLLQRREPYAPHCWTTCINVEGDYDEKQMCYFSKVDFYF